MNPKLFGAIVVVGAALGASASCRTGILSSGDQPVAHDFAVADRPGAVDLAQPPVDLAQPPVDLAQADLPTCCNGIPGDMSGCIVLPCVLIL